MMNNADSHPVNNTKKRQRTRRGQSTVEMALVVPLLILLFSVIIEAGLALNSWMRVNTAARDAARFTLDAGRPADAASLVLYKLQGMSDTEISVSVITGTTNSSGLISVWNVIPVWGLDPVPNVTRQQIQDRLIVSGQPTANRNLPFTVVEVRYNYAPFLATLLAPDVLLPMSSYALVQDVEQ